MLKVSSRAWHYRLRAQVFEKPPKDLCSYFWSTVFAAVAMVGFGVVQLVVWLVAPLVWAVKKIHPKLAPHGETIAAVIIYTIVAAVVLFGLGSLLWALIWNTEDFLWGLLVVSLWIGGIVLVAAAVAGLVAGGVHLAVKYHRSRPPKPSKPKPERPAKPKKEKIDDGGDTTWTLFWGFIGSKKRKVCPLIEVVGLEQQKPEVSPF